MEENISPNAPNLTRTCRLRSPPNSLPNSLTTQPPNNFSFPQSNRPNSKTVIRRRRKMLISDALVGHLITIYLGVIAAMKAYGIFTGRSFTGVFVLAASTAVVGIALIAALTWDVSRKAACPFSREHVHVICRGGICWHGVAVKSPASQFRFRLPHQPM